MLRFGSVIGCLIGIPTFELVAKLFLSNNIPRSVRFKGKLFVISSQAVAQEGALAASQGDIPLKINHHILDSAHDSSNLFSLIVTAKSFTLFWKSSTASISDAVLGCSIEYYSFVKH